LLHISYMHIAKISCVSVLILVLCAGCKKYPENKFFQLVNPKKAIIGNWAFKGFYVDGEDSTYKQLTLCNPLSVNPGTIVWQIENITNEETKYKSSFTHLYQKVNDIFCSCIKYYPLPSDVTGEVDLVQKKNDLSIGYTHDPGYSINYQDFFGKIYSSKTLNSNDYNWEIKKLTKSDLALEKLIGEKRYRVEFTKQ
jgi:hypothetical protein